MEFYYGDKVKVIGGFYKGVTGVVDGEWFSFFGRAYWIRGEDGFFEVVQAKYLSLINRRKSNGIKIK